MSSEGVIFEAEDEGLKGGFASMFVQANQNLFRKRTKVDIEAPEKQKRESIRKFDAIVRGSGSVLLKIKAVFPFDLFPDQIVIDPNKVNIIKKSFFLTEKLHSISIKAITDVYIQTAPFFASLHIMDNSVANNVIIVKYLWKKEAESARRVIQGLMDAARQEVDIHSLGEVDGIGDKLFESGRIETPHVSVRL